MDWFQRLTGFREVDYESTQSRLVVEGEKLRSLVNGKSYGIGDLELVSLADVRTRVQAAAGLTGRLRVKVVQADVRDLKLAPEYARAVFQVASQFNLLEMTSPDLTPEDGVGRYQYDLTQGPACAVAAGAATIYRNYFVPVAGGYGQTRQRQLDGLADVGQALSEAIGKPVGKLWLMRNGYALCTAGGLDAITRHIGACSPGEVDDLRGLLRIGLHRDVEVTQSDGGRKPLVSQAFCSALPVGYTRVSRPAWRAFALLVLEAAYEATMLSGVLNVQRGASNIVVLTLLGGGVFGNDTRWIYGAIRRALKLNADRELDVRIVSHGSPSRELLSLAAEFQRGL